MCIYINTIYLDVLSGLDPLCLRAAGVCFGELFCATSKEVAHNGLKGEEHGECGYGNPFMIHMDLMI